MFCLVWWRLDCYYMFCYPNLFWGQLPRFCLVDKRAPNRRATGQTKKRSTAWHFRLWNLGACKLLQSMYGYLRNAHIRSPFGQQHSGIWFGPCRWFHKHWKVSKASNTTIDPWWGLQASRNAICSRDLPPHFIALMSKALSSSRTASLASPHFK